MPFQTALACNEIGCGRGELDTKLMYDLIDDDDDGELRRRLSELQPGNTPPPGPCFLLNDEKPVSR